MKGPKTLAHCSPLKSRMNLQWNGSMLLNVKDSGDSNDTWKAHVLESFARYFAPDFENARNPLGVFGLITQEALSRTLTARIRSKVEKPKRRRLCVSLQENAGL